MNLSAVDLNLLWVLHAVLAERSVARAAARLAVTSPAVSNALARLRAALGDPLFVRSGRGLAPTPRALELAPVLARSFGEIEAVLRAGADFDARACTRELTIALSDADQIAALARIARAFARRLPRARLRVVSLDTLVSGGGLSGPAVDVAIGPAYDEDGVRRRPLFVEEATFVVRRGHPRVGRALSRERFNAERHVDIHLLLGRAGVGHRTVADALASAGLVRQIAVTVPTFAAAAGVAAATDLVAGMPKRVARLLGRALPIRAVTGPGPPFRFEMCLHWHERTHADPAAAAFRELIAEALGAPAPAPAG